MTNSLTEKLKKKLAFDQTSVTLAKHKLAKNDVESRGVDYDEYSWSTGDVRFGFTEGAKYEHERLRPVLEALILCVELFEQSVTPERDNISAPEDETVNKLGEQIGYGALMDSAMRMWRKKLAKKDAVGFVGGEFTIGHCRSTVERALSKLSEAVGEE